MPDANTPWGASPADWSLFADTLGLKADLLPVVSNPQARNKLGGVVMDRKALLAAVEERIDELMAKEECAFDRATYVAFAEEVINDLLANVEDAA